jgi:hypothetical protein
MDRAARNPGVDTSTRRYGAGISTHRVDALWRCAGLLLLLSQPLLANPEPGSTGQSVSNAVPGDAELESAGAVIGKIEVDNQDVFDPRDPREDRALFRLSNRLHIETQPNLILQQVLFKPGDRYSRRILEESERILRAERFLYDASIVPTRYTDGVVDVRITTRDVWSLNPGISFGRRGGKSAYGIELEELNLFGRGVGLAIASKSGVDRDVRQIDFVDRHLLGTRAQLLASYANNSDGDEWQFALERPFYSLDSRWSAGLQLAQLDRVDPLYGLGVVEYEFREQARTAELFGGWSAGLKHGWVQRWLWGITRDERRFDALPDAISMTRVPSDRDLVYPWMGWELAEDDFDVRRNHDQIGRTEDVFLGTRLQARLGYSGSGLGADRNALIYRVAADRGLQLTPRSQLTFSSSLNGRFEGDTNVDMLFESRTRYYFEQDEHWLFFASADAAFGDNLDIDHQVLLGGDNGLRGYPLNFQAGDKRARFTLEQRYFTDWYPLRLFRVGAAVFLDAGRTWGDDPLNTPDYGMLKDIGIGLRLGNSRSGLGSVIHVDLAFPLDGPDDIDNVQFLIETRKEF